MNSQTSDITAKGYKNVSLGRAVQTEHKARGTEGREGVEGVEGGLAQRVAQLCACAAFRPRAEQCSAVQILEELHTAPLKAAGAVESRAETRGTNSSHPVESL